MPRGKRNSDLVLQDSSSSPKKSVSGKWTFVEITLTQEDKDALRSGWKPQMGLEQYLMPLVDYGFKVSFTFDDYNDCYIATLTGTKTSKKNAGKSISGRGGTFYQAWLSLMYRFEVYCVGGQIPNPTDLSNEIDFD